MQWQSFVYPPKWFCVAAVVLANSRTALKEGERFLLREEESENALCRLQHYFSVVFLFWGHLRRSGNWHATVKNRLSADCDSLLPFVARLLVDSLPTVGRQISGGALFQCSSQTCINYMQWRSSQLLETTLNQFLQPLPWNSRVSKTNVNKHLRHTLFLPWTWHPLVSQLFLWSSSTVWETVNL